MADTSLAGGDSVTISGGSSDSVTVGSNDDSVTVSGGSDDSVTVGSGDSVTTGGDTSATIGGGDSVTVSGGDSTDTKESKDNIYEQDESGNYKKYDGIKDNIIDPVNDDLQVKKAKLKAQQEWIKKNIESKPKVSLAGGASVNVGQNQDGVFTLKTQEDSAVVNSKADNDQATTQKKQDPRYLDRRPAWIDTNIEYHRVKTADGISVDSAYIKRYYSVIDAEVYFGNEYVEDIHDINWSIKQNVMPVFGYNSYTYDELARGNRVIYGSFLINFTSPNYLFSILETANKANVMSITNMQSYTVPLLRSSAEPQIRGGTIGSRERGHHANIWPQTFDIDIIFGEKTGAGDPVHILLLGCAIQDCQMALSASATGSPPVVMERYSFIAQDIRTVVSSDSNEVTDKVTNAVSEATVYEDESEPDDKKVEEDVTDDTDSDSDNGLASLSKLKVSNENKEMAQRYRDQIENKKKEQQQETKTAKATENLQGQPQHVVTFPFLIDYLKDLNSKVSNNVPVSGTDNVGYYNVLKQQYWSSTDTTITFRIRDKNGNTTNYTFDKAVFDAWGKPKSYYLYNEE